MEHIKTENRYVIVQIGGKQYQAVEGKTVAIDKIEGNPGQKVEFKEILFKKNAEGSFEFGKPFLSGIVTASIIKHDKDKKIIAYRHKRRKMVRVKRGHRRQFTVIRIELIQL